MGAFLQSSRQCFASYRGKLIGEVTNLLLLLRKKEFWGGNGNKPQQRPFFQASVLHFRQAVASKLHFRQIDGSNFTA
jgi:hypothetical protein